LPNLKNPPILVKMKVIFLFLFSVSLLFSQSKDSSAKGTLTPGGNKASSQDLNATVLDDELDKIFYQYYFYQKEPDFEDLLKEQNITIKSNLIQAIKNEVFIRDPQNFQKASAEIDSPDAKIKFKQVSRYSIWMKKIKKEMGYIYFTDFMYIIQYDKYIALVLYEVDPKKHLLKPSQVELILKKEGKKESE
jgi:hypothetical protein